MYSLGELRAQGKLRLAEISPVFWSDEDYRMCVNDAQRFVAGATKGVPSVSEFTLSAAGESFTPIDPLERVVVADAPIVGEVLSPSPRSLVSVPRQAADVIDPAWRYYTGNPRWLIVDMSPSDNPRTITVYVTPSPVSGNVTARITTRVLPADLLVDADLLFNNYRPMEKYQGVVLLLACAYMLLKERFDGDAERFYQMALGELQALTPLTESIPASILGQAQGG